MLYKWEASGLGLRRELTICIVFIQNCVSPYLILLNGGKIMLATPLGFVCKKLLIPRAMYTPLLPSESIVQNMNPRGDRSPWTEFTSLLYAL